MEETISEELELFYNASQTKVVFDERAYEQKYAENGTEQNWIEQAHELDARVLAVKKAYDKKGRFTHKISILLEDCLEDYRNFSVEVQRRVKSTEVLEQLRSINNEYFSTDAIISRKAKFRENLISWAVFGLIAAICAAGILLLLIKGSANVGLDSKVFLGICFGICLLLGFLAFKTIKNRWVLGGAIACLVALLVVGALQAFL